jgi:ParB-like chromosome segregation protein Spo0J
MKKLSKKEWVEISIDKLVKADWNYKKEDSETADKLIANIKRNGQVENILIRELPTGFYEVVNGNHRLDAFKKLELETCVCYNMGKITDAHARRIAIETNETGFERDNKIMAEVLKEITDDEQGEFTLDELVETMPFDAEDIEGFAALADFKFDEGKEIDIDKLNDDMKLVFVYPEEKYNKIVEALSKVSDDQNEALLKILDV